MDKFTQTSWWDFGMEPTQLIKSASTLVKRASVQSDLKYEKTKGQEDLHIIALGAYEGTGFNRNGDCFREYWCEKNAHYFKDADRAVHRHHKNKPTDPKFGNVKAAAYNKPMKRIELIVGLDMDKCADILDEQEKKGVTNWSMASKQAHDVCTWCDHAAKTDFDRCAHIPDKIGELNKEGKLCGMDNPDPHWFEISYVKRGADRIGLSLQKAAGDKVSPMLPRDYINLFPGYESPSDSIFSISKKASDKRKLLQKLSELEKHLNAVGEIPTAKKTEIGYAATDKIAATLMDELRNTDPAKFFKFAAEKGIVFSPENFFGYVFGSRIKEASINEVKTLLRDIFSTIEKDAEVLNNETYDAMKPIFDARHEKGLLDKIALTHSMYQPYVNRRVLSNLEKVAETTITAKSGDKYAMELAKQYVSYKLAALNMIDELGKLDEGLLMTAVLQNRL